MALQNITDKQLFPVLTGWRLPLALWVLFYHLNAILYDLFQPPLIVMDILQRGYFAVDVFFTISGLVIAHHYGAILGKFQKRDYLHFLWLRLARVYPLHLTILLALAMMVILAPVLDYRINQPQDYSLPLFIANLALVQAWSIPDDLDWNHPAWAISAEWFAYLASPFLFRILNRNWSRSFYLLLGLAALALPVIIRYATQQEHGTFALYRVIGDFTAGICLYHILPVSWRLLQKPGFLLNRAWLYGGQISYALYMVQYPVLLVMRKVWPHQHIMHDTLLIRLLYMVILITLVVSTAILCYHLIEEPARRYLRQRNPFKR
ncbi:MAG TPA: acyltransferase [Alphaproteobacteria bacterium]